MDHYEVQARNHIKQYIAMMKNPHELPDIDLIGSRNDKSTPKRSELQEIAALTFFQELLNSLDDFKAFCQNNPHETECAMLEEDKSLISEFLNKSD